MKTEHLPDPHERKLIVLLDRAPLELVQLEGSTEIELLDPEKHPQLILKSGREVASVRPDIAHQCLMMLQASPLNRANLLQVYIRTWNNVLIRVSPHLRCPRSFVQFSRMMQVLLQRMRIVARGKGNKTLLRVVAGPFSQYLPLFCNKYATSLRGSRLVDVETLVPQHDSQQKTAASGDESERVSSVLMVVGAMAHGSVEPEFPVDETIRISPYPLSGALTCAKLCHAFETVWNLEEGDVE